MRKCIKCNELTALIPAANPAFCANYCLLNYFEQQIMDFHWCNGCEIWWTDGLRRCPKCLKESEPKVENSSTAIAFLKHILKEKPPE
jgi:hypothetical protein